MMNRVKSLARCNFMSCLFDTVMSGSNEDFYTYKARKEAFVSNLKGTTRYEVVVVAWCSRLYFICAAPWHGMVFGTIYTTFIKKFLLLVLCQLFVWQFSLIIRCIIFSAITLGILIQTCFRTNTQKVHEERLGSLKIHLPLTHISVWRDALHLHCNIGCWFSCIS